MPSEADRATEEWNRLCKSLGELAGLFKQERDDLRKRVTELEAGKERVYIVEQRRVMRGNKQLLREAVWTVQRTEADAFAFIKPRLSALDDREWFVVLPMRIGELGCSDIVSVDRHGRYSRRTQPGHNIDFMFKEGEFDGWI